MPAQTPSRVQGNRGTPAGPRPLGAVATELLVLRCQRGDERALAALYEYWHPRLARHAARLTGRAEAVAEVSQETWLAIARGIKKLDDPARFPAWAYRIVTRKCTDWIRRRMREAGRAAPLEHDPPAPAGTVAAGDDVAALRSAMRRLPAEQLEVIALFYGASLGIHAIARALEVPAGTVKSRLHHGRRTLARTLERTEP